MKSVACIGDCVVDIFKERGEAYPGGNALNVAAYLTDEFGMPTTFTGIVGDDEFGDHILWALAQVGVPCPNVRRAYGSSGQALVGLTAEGDRVFLASNGGGVQRGLSIRLTPDDEALLGAADLIHTSVYSGIDHELPRLAALAPVSYDFSDAPAIGQIVTVVPHLSIAFFSAAQLDERERLDYARKVLALGATTVVMTAGSAGALGVSADQIVAQPIIPTEVVDTLGAGDGFISGFLHAWLTGANLAESMAAGAHSGARACSFKGAFGYPLPVAGEVVRALETGFRNVE